MFIPKATPPPGPGEQMRTWKHEDASVEMFDHLVRSNRDLWWMMKACGLNLTEDLEFIKEMIKPRQLKRKSWPYEGRPEEKSFLYEIVNNKRNGIDVDKFDYFARDSYHLGIKNNFDHGRFIKFARVCEVDEQKGDGQKVDEVDEQKGDGQKVDEVDEQKGDRQKMDEVDEQGEGLEVNRQLQKHICTRDKDYRAFLNADEHIQIEGSGGEMFTLSTAIDDMEAYTKLTDCVFDQILNSTEDNLREAREILTNIVDRKHYRCLGEIKPEGIPTEEEISQLEVDLAAALPFPRRGAQADGLREEDFVVLPVTMDYGMKGKDPIDSMDFYSKKNPTQAFKIKREEVSKLLPEHFSETLFRVYSRKIDPESLEAARGQLEQWINLRNEQLPVERHCLLTQF
ncbi:hypothetical protein F7725_000811 [Dissostichus mawsoni]|uniref:Uncharacterized protein n=1 Tax=Dissostichus mawsoni TaxID=36200 RepID=A0A7J5ZFZ7_DISMA|nr:hypothetical protein F7725_000811 [Dissostichus mawsoni]